MELGNVVEFIDTQKIICGVVLDKKKLRLRLLTEHNREVMLPVVRLCHQSDLNLDIGMGRDKLVAQLKAIAIRRRTLSEQIDIPSLWEVLNSEQEWIDLPTMTAFCFPGQVDGDQVSATLRAFFHDRLYFKFSPDRFFPLTEDQVEQIKTQRKEAEILERLVNDGAAWMKKVETRKASPPETADTIIKILSDYFLFEKESPRSAVAKAILKKAGASSPSAIFTFLVQIGHWHAHENLDLIRYGIASDFPVAVETQASNLCRDAVTVKNGRQDLRHLELTTIDGPATLDFDDAVSLTQASDHLILGIHIADVGYYISREDPIDQEALARASSIYMPDQKIPMLPPQLSEDLCSLKLGQERPAISTLIRITPQAEIVDCQIVPSIVCVKQQLTFQDIDNMAATDNTVKMLHMLAKNYRERRLDDGALSIDMPEVNVWLGNDGQPHLATVARTGIGRTLVAELMIMANAMAAQQLADHHLPAIFRSQAKPKERLFPRDRGTLFQNWMQRKLLRRFQLGSDPQPHSGLGVPSYVTATSPIRKYTDLVTQRQLRAISGLEQPYTHKEMEQIIVALEKPLSQVGRTQFSRHRYWLLKHLETRTGEQEEAMVLFKRRRGFVVLLTKYLLECPLSGADGVRLKPEDLIRVTVQHVNARNDVINVHYG